MTLKSLLQHHSSKASILQRSGFFTVQLSYAYMTTGKTIALTRRTFVGKVTPLLLNMVSSLVVTFLPRSSVQFSSVARSCPTLCEPMDCSTPGFPVHHQLLELAQTHVYRVGDAIQPSHPLSATSPLPSVFPSIRVFSNELVLHIKWPKYWSFPISPSNEYLGLISFRTDWFDFLAVQGTRAA